MPTGRFKRLPVFLGLAVCLSAPGCRHDQASAARRLPAGAPMAIDSVPRLRVGVVEGDTTQEFDRVVTPFLLPDGRLVVPVAGAGVIRVFGPDGGLLASLGRPGQGPGEFASLGAAWARGDTIEAFDGRLGRVTRFLPDGTVDVVPLDMVPSAQMSVPGVVAGGWIVAGVAGAGMGRRDSMVVHRFARDGAHAGVIAHVQGMSRFSTPQGSGPDPLSPRAVFAVHGDRVYVAETLTPVIGVFGPAGQMEREITWRPGTAPAPRAAFETVVAAVAAQAGPERASSIRRRLETFPVRDRVSAFWDFLVDDDGFVWIQPFDPRTSSLLLDLVAGTHGASPGGRWLVVAPDGRPAGNLRVPDGFQPTQITTDAVVGIRRNALGVEFVEVRRLARR